MKSISDAAYAAALLLCLAGLRVEAQPAPVSTPETLTLDQAIARATAK